MCTSKLLVWHVYRRHFDYLSVEDSDMQVLTTETVHGWSWKPLFNEILRPWLSFHANVAFITSHGQFVWSAVQYRYLVLISDQNDVERYVIPVVYLYTSNYGLKWSWSINKWSGVVLLSCFLRSLINGTYWLFWYQNQVSSAMHLCRGHCISIFAGSQYSSTFSTFFLHQKQK